MKTYLVPQVSGEPDWDAVPAASIDTLQWSPPVPVRAEARLCWDRDALLVRLRAWEPAVRAVHRGRLCAVCEDSCLEFFLRPGADLRYLNFEFNPNCALYLGIGTGMDNLVRLLPQDPGQLFRPKADRLPDGWQIRYRVPFSFLRVFFPAFAPAAGLVLHGNFYKCGDRTEQEHYLAWSPLTSAVPSFHRPQDFGELILG